MRETPTGLSFVGDEAVLDDVVDDLGWGVVVWLVMRERRNGVERRVIREEGARKEGGSTI